MCDPVSMTAVALTAAGTGANAMAQSSARKSQQKTMNANTAAQAASFDQRMALASGSDERTMDLVQRQYGDTSGLQDTTFDYLLNQSQERADSQDLAAKGLITAQTQNNQERVQTKAAEAAQQSGFADRLMTQVSEGIRAATSQFAQAGKFGGDRLDLIKSALGGPSTGAPAGADELVQRAYADRAQAAHDTALSEGAAGAQVGGMQDASSWAGQIMDNKSRAVDRIQGRAALSKAQLGDELANVDASDQLAANHASFAGNLAEWLEGQKTNAWQTYAQNEGSALDSYYGNSLGSEGEYTQGMIGSNQHQDDTRTSLANYKIGNTQANTTFGDLLKLGGSALGAGASLGTLQNGMGTTSLGTLMRARGPLTPVAMQTSGIARATPFSF